MWSGNVNEKCVKKLEEFLLKRTEIEIIGLENRSKLESEGKLDEQGCYVVEQPYKFKLLDKEYDDSLKVKRIYQLDKPELLETNFSQELFDILAETKLFKILNKIIPDKAQEVYDTGNDYRQVKNQLDDIVQKYNYV